MVVAQLFNLYLLSSHNELDMRNLGYIWMRCTCKQTNEMKHLRALGHPGLTWLPDGPLKDCWMWWVKWKWGKRDGGGRDVRLLLQTSQPSLS